MWTLCIPITTPGNLNYPFIVIISFVRNTNKPGKKVYKKLCVEHYPRAPEILLQEKNPCAQVHSPVTSILGAQETVGLCPNP